MMNFSIFFLILRARSIRIPPGTSRALDILLTHYYMRKRLKTRRLISWESFMNEGFFIYIDQFKKIIYELRQNLTRRTLFFHKACT